MSFGQILLLLILGYLLYSAGRFFFLIYKGVKRARNIQDEYQRNAFGQSGRSQRSSGGEKDITRQSKVVDERWLDEDKQE